MQKIEHFFLDFAVYENNLNGARARENNENPVTGPEREPGVELEAQQKETVKNRGRAACWQREIPSALPAAQISCSSNVNRLLAFSASSFFLLFLRASSSALIPASFSDCGGGATAGRKMCLPVAASI